ncbi:uncharacterized protein A4U43_C02F4010 [Asparagus officinalis]|uniref:Peptide N-acetyl-beta-D-glucosaminyl asparaginase amidase A N-terminal domain-containing protein n=1 Tax=Asparagus officinalis TaxID=4686 RepID=A0A5P1FJS7_ASPOF|nr:uncharacterized protein A4U43_C02F4010 [Asparagus officinalis]
MNFLTNPPNRYTNPLRAEYEAGGHANGGFRQVYATIDGQFVGGHIPFPVIYPGSINPFFWSPVSAIGAFDMPSYDLDITPFLGAMLDGQPHEIGIGVKDAQKFWLVTANLHVWVDVWSDATEGGLVSYSEVDGEGLVKFVGWVKSSKGNLTTMVRMKIKFKNQVEVQNRGAVRQVEMINKERMTIGQTNERHQILGRVQLFTESPLQIQSSTVNAIGGATFQKTSFVEYICVGKNNKGDGYYGVAPHAFALKVLEG